MDKQHGQTVEAPPTGDAILTSLFGEYCRAIAELNAKGDIDNPDCPHLLAFQSASDAMLDAPIPVTIEGATLLLRYSLSMGTKKEIDDVIIHGTAADRKRFYQEREADIDHQERAGWKALIGMESRVAAEASQLAYVWIDRWRALGGTFGATHHRDGTKSANRGIPVALEYWTPTDRGREDLPPHAWLTEEQHHAGAQKVLEGFLELVPGLQEAVFAIVKPTIPSLVEEE